jgi:hypothetical protein
VTEFPDHSKDLSILSTGEIVPSGLWLGRYEDDGDYCVYYTSHNGICYGTQSEDCEML